MGGTACYTSCTYSYLSRARVLVQTLRAAHPDWSIWVVIVDLPPPCVDVGPALAEFDGVVAAQDLPIPNFRRWLFKHNIVEACTAVKACMLRHLLALGFDKIVYLDPDIGVFHSLAMIERRLDRGSIVLTPHQIEPNDDRIAIADNELTSMKYGIFNLGFIAVRNDRTGNAFAIWWDRMLQAACYEDIEVGIFTDQKYCDLVPALFDHVQIERDPGCNVASWNISRRFVEITSEGDITVNGSPLKFYHFTKIGSVGDVMMERYADDNPAVFDIWSWYRRAITTSALVDIPKGYWHYGSFSNGVPISAEIRRYYRNRDDLMAAFADPFYCGTGSFFEWLEENEPELLGGAAQDPKSWSDTRPAPSPSPSHVDTDMSVDEDWYLAANPDAADAVRTGTCASALDHYLRIGMREGRLPAYIAVDEDFYLGAYPDVKNAISSGDIQSAQVHFDHHGYKEGRQAYPGHFTSRQIVARAIK